MPLIIVAQPFCPMYTLSVALPILDTLFVYCCCYVCVHMFGAHVYECASASTPTPIPLPMWRSEVNTQASAVFWMLDSGCQARVGSRFFFPPESPLFLDVSYMSAMCLGFVYFQLLPHTPQAPPVQPLFLCPCSLLFINTPLCLVSAS